MSFARKVLASPVKHAADPLRTQDPSPYKLLSSRELSMVGEVGGQLTGYIRQGFHYKATPREVSWSIQCVQIKAPVFKH